MTTVENFGTVSADGYVKLPNCLAQVRLDACEAFEGVLEEFHAAVDESGWHLLKLQGREEARRVHHNWVEQWKALKPGDRVEGVLNRLDDTFWLLRRKEMVPDVGTGLTAP